MTLDEATQIIADTRAILLGTRLCFRKVTVPQLLLAADVLGVTPSEALGLS
ncbi:hypothetical protein ABLE94_05325 [Gordonia sp. VNK1]|uniref:hypothetical protein n=1 Tax=Gordonia oleivorans TaxID=3156618 RepID=UPI0032B330F1